MPKYIENTNSYLFSIINCKKVSFLETLKQIIVHVKCRYNYMKINKTVKIILIIMIPSIVIVNALIVWLSLEGQKEKIKEFLYLKNLNKTLLDLKNGKITLLQYCSQVPASVYGQERICSKYNKSY